MTNISPPADWLDVAPAPKRRPRTRKAKKVRKKAETRVVAGNAIPREAARRFPPGRIWGCDGCFVFFRPKRMIDGVFTQVANPEAMERHQRFINKGDYQYIETQDDVQIFRVMPQSPLARKFGSLMEMNESTLKRACFMAAVKREWPVYVDALEEIALRIKLVRPSDGQGAGPLQATQWNEMLTYIEIQIAQRGGPTREECAMNLQRVRIARQGGSEKRILLV